ncbi:MGMT family protein [Flavihumibacter fluvii]|uniref:MGMT family protein n=1 Tax=Flavihumibacter fluvii TaxID=2838157 RepID=UPI001BDF1317|nr:MGMT family protein [Flavihumibacter fluvii]ULQ51577.1 MGMT family protein [Flavihumibacter fluvii]
MLKPVKPVIISISKGKTKKQSLKELQPSGKAASSFFEQVYDIVEQVPKGKVTTYGAIAKALGSGLSARMVGWALNGAHNGIRPIPAQRVVNRNGQLSGKSHFSTPTRMQELLEKDGITVENDTVKNFSFHFWDPAAELEV